MVPRASRALCLRGRDGPLGPLEPQQWHWGELLQRRRLDWEGFLGGAQPTSLCHPLSPKRTFGALTIQLPTKTRSFILDWCEVKLADAPAKNHFISETQAEPGPFSLQRAKRYEFTGACSYGEGHTGIFQSGVEITLFANTWKSKLFVDAGFR